MEFLIQRTDGDWFDIHHDQLSSILHPNSFPYSQLSGQGSVCINVQDTTITCYDEMPGYQIVFEGTTLSEDAAKQIVQEMLINITNLTGQTGEVIQTA